MITQHQSRKYRTGDYGEGEPCHFVECDFCRKAAPIGNDIGDAAERARKAGFKTVRGASIEDPRKWVCPGCPNSPEKS
jgi:hypothetical protein